MLNEYARISHEKFLVCEREKLRADKRLRDAAPDLLAALQNIAERKGKTLANFNEMQAVARAAIAKAEGVS